MKIEHVAIWSSDLERLKEFYMKYFGGKPGLLYHNEKKSFRSYFLNFSSGARLEIMNAPEIPENLNDTKNAQHLGIVHIAFETGSAREVDEKAEQMRRDGFEILDGPRITGDGHYEFAVLDPEGNRLEVTTTNY